MKLFTFFSFFFFFFNDILYGAFFSARVWFIVTWSGHMTPDQPDHWKVVPSLVSNWGRLVGFDVICLLNSSELLLSNIYDLLNSTKSFSQRLCQKCLRTMLLPLTQRRATSLNEPNEVIKTNFSLNIWTYIAWILLHSHCLIRPIFSLRLVQFWSTLKTWPREWMANSLCSSVIALYVKPSRQSWWPWNSNTFALRVMYLPESEG